MKHLLLLISFAFTAGLYAQKSAVDRYASVDKAALAIPDSLTATTSGIARYINENFSFEGDKARAAFVWVASNIEYDLANMFAIDFYEPKEKKIEKPLATRKGICENYAALFVDICSKAGIKSYVATGYVRQNGFTDYVPHAWCVAFVDGRWVILDPTWGAGYVSNGKFVKKLNNSHYMTPPAESIKSHMPFDYLWQLFEYPVTAQEFYEDKITVNRSKPYFNYADSLATYETQTREQHLKGEVHRIEANGIRNSLTFDRLQHIKLELENIKIIRENQRLQGIYDLFNSSVEQYNDGIAAMNSYIAARNNQFRTLGSDEEISRAIDAPVELFKRSKSLMEQIKEPDQNLERQIAQLSQTLDSALKQSQEQQKWVETYLSKSKLARKAMLAERITWFGIPLK